MPASSGRAIIVPHPDLVERTHDRCADRELVEGCPLEVVALVVERDDVTLPFLTVQLGE